MVKKLRISVWIAEDDVTRTGGQNITLFYKNNSIRTRGSLLLKI